MPRQEPQPRWLRGLGDSAGLTGTAGRIPGNRPCVPPALGNGIGCWERLGLRCWERAGGRTRPCSAEQGPPARRKQILRSDSSGSRAADWLPLLSPGRSIEQIRAGGTMRERALQTPITPELINVVLNKHHGSASDGVKAAAEVSRRSNSLARGDGVGRIPQQE